MDKAMEALKPCPFCGGEAELSNGGPGNWYVRCPDCKAAGRDCGRDRAIAAWNTRATPEPVAPTPSPDIAGLADRLGSYYEAAEIIQRVAQERDAANKLNNRYAWERDKAREERDAAERRSEAFWKPQLAAAEARLSSARDEGLRSAEIAAHAALLDVNVTYKQIDPVLDAIRALKGTKP